MDSPEASAGPAETEHPAWVRMRLSLVICLMVKKDGRVYPKGMHTILQNRMCFIIFKQRKNDKGTAGRLNYIYRSTRSWETGFRSLSALIALNCISIYELRASVLLIRPHCGRVDLLELRRQPPLYLY